MSLPYSAAEKALLREAAILEGRAAAYRRMVAQKHQQRVAAHNEGVDKKSPIL